MTRKFSKLIRYSLLTLLPLAALACLRAQSLSDASKSAGISVFAGFSYAKPDYGPRHDKGGTASVAYTRYLGYWIVPSVELRVNKYTGFVMNQEALMGGLRVQAELKSRFHPYANVFYGAQRIVFNFPLNPTYTHDQGPMFAYGGGVDIDVRRSFQARLDILQENSNFGPNGTQPGNADFTLSPTVVTVGVNYRIPFRSHRSR